MHLWLMIRLHQISKRHDTFDAFLRSSGISKGTLWKLMRGEGNPTISLLQRIADSQKMSFIELLGLDPENVRKDLEKVGIDAEQLAAFSKGEKRSRKTMAKMLEKSGAYTARRRAEIARDCRLYHSRLHRLNAPCRSRSRALAMRSSCSRASFVALACRSALPLASSSAKP